MLQSRRALVPHFFKSTYSCSLRSPGGAAPLRRDPIFNPRIIYDGNESINNSRKIDAPRAGGAAPPGEARNNIHRERSEPSVAGGATPGATPPLMPARSTTATGLNTKHC
jgi:hypothetical protein